MMSLNSKHELVDVVRPRYLKARKAEKQQFLEFTSATGYHRKHAIRVLKNRVPKSRRRKRTGYPSVYDGEVVQALEPIWEIYGHICSKRLQPFLPEAIQILERCQEIELSEETKELLLKISSASMDHCLRTIRRQTPDGLKTTKPGSLLKKSIPVRTFTEWDEERPGFLEIDLVAHCGPHHGRAIPEYLDLHGSLYGLDRCHHSAPSLPRGGFRSHPAHAPTIALSVARHRFG
jgi:hypothetical protein